MDDNEIDEGDKDLNNQLRDALDERYVRREEFEELKREVEELRGLS